MRKVSLAIIALIVFTIAATLLATTATDAVYMWSNSQTGGDAVAALQLVFLVAYILFVGALMVMTPSIMGMVPFRPIGFFVAMAAIGYACYWGIGYVAGG